MVCIIISYCYVLRAVHQQILTGWHFIIISICIIQPIISVLVSSLSAQSTAIVIPGSCSPHHFKLLFLVLLNILLINEEFNHIFGIFLFSEHKFTHFVDSFERHLQLLLCFNEYLFSCFSSLLDVLDCSSYHNDDEDGQDCQENDQTKGHASFFFDRWCLDYRLLRV